MFYPEQYSLCSPEMKALSYDWTAMKTLVDGLYPNGSTNQPIGLVWGWQSLAGGGPFGAAPAKDPNYTYREVIILLSDGMKRRTAGTATASNIDTGRRPHVDDRRRRHLQERQGRRRHDLRHPGQHRRRPAVDVLQNCATNSQVRDADHGEPDHHDVPADRDAALATAHREVGVINAAGTKSAGKRLHASIPDKSAGHS